MRSAGARSRAATMIPRSRSAPAWARWPRASPLSAAPCSSREAAGTSSRRPSRARNTRGWPMLSLLAAYYEASYGPLRILHYITFRTLLAAGTAAFIGFIIGPWLIAHLRRLKFGQHYDDDRTGDLASRFDKKNTPTMGGLLIFACVFGSSVLWAAPNVWVVVALFVYTALTAVGFRDDYLKVVRKSRHGISSGAKIFWQSVTTAV